MDHKSSLTSRGNVHAVLLLTSIATCLMVTALDLRAQTDADAVREDGRYVRKQGHQTGKRSHGKSGYRLWARLIMRKDVKRILN